MIWVLLGAVIALLCVVAWVIWRTDRVLVELGERIDARPVPTEPVTLSEEQKRDLTVVWAQVVCVFCGNVHEGLCPRIREVRYQVNSNFERVIFWRQWRQRPGAVSPWDVFGNVAPPQEGEGEKAS